DLSAYAAAGANFWTDFDYSAFFDTAGVGLQFHQRVPNDSLSTGTVLTASQVLPKVLGQPAYRFGFCSNTANGNFGFPREYVSTGGNTYFIGRFTQGETSDLSFGYPGRNGSDPMDNMALTFDATTYRVTNFNGTRAGEDVLMSNVLAFDIKVWDPAAGLG